MAAFGQELVGGVLGGRYTGVPAPVGTGASATVYGAEDVSLRRSVTWKFLHPSLADDPAFIKRFHAEAQAAAGNDHPNVMAVYDWGEEPRCVRIWCSSSSANGSLRAMLERGRRLSPSRRCSSVSRRHAVSTTPTAGGFVVRDVKPANVLLATTAAPHRRLGLARAIAEAAWTKPAGVGARHGTLHVTPNKPRASQWMGRTDVYSLTLVLVEAITGTVPFSADTTVATLMNRIDKLMPVTADVGAVGVRGGRAPASPTEGALHIGRTGTAHS